MKGECAFIPGAIDLSDTAQAHTFLETQRVLAIESSAGEIGIQPYIIALDDQIPWIRDFSARHLINSETCSATPNCVDALLSTIRNLLRSKKPIERLEALNLLKSLAEPGGVRNSGKNGLPMMSNSEVRQMLVLAVSDSNIALGDKAFQELQLFDFYHSAKPGDCIEIVPALRQSARWTSDEAKPKSFGGPFGGAFAFTPTP